MQFPRGYWLYEKSKHLWVSGYPIKAKLFKSPQEFAIHLIWLLSAAMDYRDCCCAHCNSASSIKGAASDDGFIITHEGQAAEKGQPKMTPVPLPQIPGQPQPQALAVPARPAAASAQAKSAVQAPIQPSPQPTPQPQAQGQPQLQAQTQGQLRQPQQQVHAQRQPQQQPPQQQQPPAQPLQQAQQQVAPQPVPWALKSPLLFRVGELVWYQNGTTWRLGLIAASSNGNHELLPIGHGMVPQQIVTKADGNLRPFHAFTVPPVSIPDLKEKMFDDISWDAIFRATANDNNKREMIALDASKMAATKVDYSYSLWSQHTEDPNGKNVTFYGCFFGAERIEVGDSLRLRSLPAEFNVPAETGVLGLRFIFTNKDFPGAVFFRGHVYQPINGDTDAPNVLSEENLPFALRDEVQWRKSSTPGERCRWALVKENVVFKEQSIRGRFYPIHRILSILNPDLFQQALARGQTDELYAHLNNRMDGGGRYIGRKLNRKDALGASVPPQARFVMEPWVREEAGLTAMGAAQNLAT